MLMFMKKRPLPRDSLTKNLKYLKDREKLSEADIARRSKVAQKTINNILNGESGAALTTIDRIAESFGLTAWHLILPELPEELLSGNSIEKLYNAFINSDAKGREYTLHVAEREANYKNKS